jgi:hypothetical protein
LPQAVIDRAVGACCGATVGTLPWVGSNRAVDVIGDLLSIIERFALDCAERSFKRKESEVACKGSTVG